MTFTLEEVPIRQFNWKGKICGPVGIRTNNDLNQALTKNIPLHYVQLQSYYKLFKNKYI